MKDKVFFFVDWWYFYRWVKRHETENVNLKSICEKIAWNREIIWICYYVWEIDIHMWKDKDSNIFESKGFRINEIYFYMNYPF